MHSMASCVGCGYKATIAQGCSCFSHRFNNLHLSTRTWTRSRTCVHGALACMHRCGLDTCMAAVASLMNIHVPQDSWGTAQLVYRKYTRPFLLQWRAGRARLYSDVHTATPTELSRAVATPGPGPGSRPTCTRPTHPWPSLHVVDVHLKRFTQVYLMQYLNITK